MFKKSEAEIEIRDSATPWQHVRLVGEDIVATEPLLPRGHKLRPYDLGALLAAGHTTIPVMAPPTVGIIPTGSRADRTRRPGRAGSDYRVSTPGSPELLWKSGAVCPSVCPESWTISKPLPRALAKAVKRHDIVIIIAGSSAGEHDFTLRALESLGEVLVHGIDVMPGKPANSGSY